MLTSNDSFFGMLQVNSIAYIVYVLRIHHYVNDKHRTAIVDSLTYCSFLIYSVHLSLNQRNLRLPTSCMLLLNNQTAFINRLRPSKRY